MKILLEMHDGKVTNVSTSEDCQLFLINHDDLTDKHLISLELASSSMELDARVMDATLVVSAGRQS